MEPLSWSTTPAEDLLWVKVEIASKELSIWSTALSVIHHGSNSGVSGFLHAKSVLSCALMALFQLGIHRGSHLKEPATSALQDEAWGSKFNLRNLDVHFAMHTLVGPPRSSVLAKKAVIPCMSTSVEHGGNYF